MLAQGYSLAAFGNAFSGINSVHFGNPPLSAGGFPGGTTWGYEGGIAFPLKTVGNKWSLPWAPGSIWLRSSSAIQPLGTSRTPKDWIGYDALTEKQAFYDFYYKIFNGKLHVFLDHSKPVHTINSVTTPPLLLKMYGRFTIDMNRL